MDNIPCNSMGHHRFSLWRDMRSFRPHICPLTSNASDQTEIILIRCLFKFVMASLQEPETGSDKVLVTAPPNEVKPFHYWALKPPSCPDQFSAFSADAFWMTMSYNTVPKLYFYNFFPTNRAFFWWYLIISAIFYFLRYKQKKTENFRKKNTLARIHKQRRTFMPP